MKFVLLTVALLFATLVENGESVRCWTCSSDVNPACNPLRTEQVQLVDCDKTVGTYSYLQSYISVCKTVKKTVNGQIVVSRGCSWKPISDITSTCLKTINPTNVVTSYCETCTFDGCNIIAPTQKNGVWRNIKDFFGNRNR